MATSNPYGTGKYKLNFGRAVSKKWKTADKVDYGGGWGDDDSDDGIDEEPEPMSADNPRHPAWAQQGQGQGPYSSARSFTNPSPTRGVQRPSFDQGDDRRHVSSAAGFDSAYPSTQRSPFPEPRHDEPSMPTYGMQPPLRLNTAQGPGGFRPGSRGRDYPQHDDVPFSAPGYFPQQRRSGSSHRHPPPVADPYARHESPMRPDSRSSNTSHRQFPPRKQSLSQQAPPPEFTQSSNSSALSHASATMNTAASEDKPTPVFIRPSDIYKRMNEEMEKVRKSQESARPSIASASTRVREGSIGARSTHSEAKEPPAITQPTTEDSDSTHRLNPTLDPVPERKSEYGLDNIVQSAGSDGSDTNNDNDPGASGVARHDTTASSVYTDRPDPISAGSLSRNVSMNEDFPESEFASESRPSFGLPPMDRFSGFGMNMDDQASLMPANMTEQKAPRPNPSRDDVSTAPEQRQLKQQPSLGYKSLVQQAFDGSQNLTPHSPVSSVDTIDRSNSASTAGISPIIARKPDFKPAPLPRQNDYSLQAPDESRSVSTSTVKPTDDRIPGSTESSSTSAIRPGYRRDMTPPSRDNSPARTPRPSAPAIVPRPPESSAIGGPATELLLRGREPDSSYHEKALPGQPQPEVMDSSMNAPSPITRSESPLKGTVRDIAGRLEGSSGRSSPTHSDAQVPLPGLSQGRPMPQSRFESFRPSIPGGWQSYASTAGPATPGFGSPSQTREEMTPRAPFAQNRSDSSESIPTARAPTGPANVSGISQAAFAAAASAGSALAGAFTGPQLSPQRSRGSQQVSEESSENEWDRSSTSSDDEPELPPSQSTIAPQHTNSTLAVASNVPLPTPEPPTSVATSTPLSFAGSSEPDVPQSTLDYFPAPLRTSKLYDGPSSRPPIPNVSIPSETPPDSENERLRDEIVKSLTPKSSNIEPEAETAGAGGPIQASSSSAYRAVTEVGSNHPSTKSALRSDTSEVRPGGPFDALGAPTVIPRYADSAPPRTSSSRSISPELSGISDPIRSSGLNESPKLGADSGPPSSNLANIPQQPSTTAINTQLPSSSGGTPVTKVAQNTPSTARPFLQQRYSWETGSSLPASVATPKVTSPASTDSPDTIRGPLSPPHSEGFSSALPPVPPLNAKPTINTSAQPLSPPLPAVPLPGGDRSPVLNRTITESSKAVSTPTGTPHNFREIMSLGSPVERIKAYEDSRDFYATPNEQFQSWLTSMKSPEHADLFATNGRPSLDTTEGAAHKPSPRRQLTESAGARQLQEYGKKLAPAAGRFSGKAGSAAKGLFAKGKEKMRNVSSSEKGTLTGRRKSTGPFVDGPDDTLSPSKTKDSTFQNTAPHIPLSITPASPLATPTEWFSTRSFGDPITNNEAVPFVAIAGAAGSKASTIIPAKPHDTSPGISDLDSDQEEVGHGVTPSRSISQLTKPTDTSPLESPRVALVDSNTNEAETATSQPANETTEPLNQTTSTLVPPRPITDHPTSSASDLASSDKSLQLPDARRSIVSDVSSASPGSVPATEGQNIRRSLSVSPADNVNVAPATKSDVSSTTAAAFGSTDPAAKQTDETHPNNGEAAGLSSALAAGAATAGFATQLRDAGPGTNHSQIPATSGQSNKISGPNQEEGSYHRPFSFAGTEGLGALHQPQPSQEQELSKYNTQPMSPISQTRSSAGLSKDLSQVSAEEMPEEANKPAQRTSRSYSRPFGVDPNVRNHPALRDDEVEQPPMDRAQMYSSESPLPSARRPQEEVGRFQQQRQQQQQQQQYGMVQQQQPPAGYRIPGPYVQEYRSPKQISSPKNGRSPAQVNASGQLPSSTTTMTPQEPFSPQRDSYGAGEQQQALPSYQDHPAYMNNPEAYAEYDMKPSDVRHSEDETRQQLPQRQSFGPPTMASVPEQSPMPTPPATSMPPQQQLRSETPTERRRSGLGKFFGGSSKPSKLQKQGRVGSPIEPAERPPKEKRGSFLRRNDSVSSKQSSRHGSQDQLGQLPPANLPTHSAKRQSRDVLRAPTPENEGPSDGKKKRFSGFGGKLFKSGSNARAATAPTPPVQEPRLQERVTSPVPQSAQPGRVMSPEQYSAHTPVGQYPAGPGSYFGQHPGQPPRSQSPYVQSPPPQVKQYYEHSSQYQQPQQPVDNRYYAVQSPPPSDFQQIPTPQPPGAFPQATQSQYRPSDLRIDTSNQPHQQYNMPATAPAQTYPSAPYNPNPNPSMPATTTTTSPPPGPDPREHVRDLHKRSRSPRMGRLPSEDLTSHQARKSRENDSTLGTFTSKRISPAGGIARPENDQERPYAINLPPGFEEEAAQRRKQARRREKLEKNARRAAAKSESSGGGQSVSAVSSSQPSGSSNPRDQMTTISSPSAYAPERAVSVLSGPHGQTSPSQSERRGGAKDKTVGGVAELPGSRALGYESASESEDGFGMSATAYPGQEWMPVPVDGRWED